MNQSNQVQHCSRWIKQQVHVVEWRGHTRGGRTDIIINNKTYTEGNYCLNYAAKISQHISSTQRNKNKRTAVMIYLELSYYVLFCSWKKCDDIIWYICCFYGREKLLNEQNPSPWKQRQQQKRCNKRQQFFLESIKTENK